MIKRNQFEELFSDSFDTFRVFHNLTTQETGRNLPIAPKTIWQILNHLIVWQDYQLMQLQDVSSKVEISEQLTWTEVEQCASQEKLDKALAKFHSQLECIKAEIAKFSLEDPELLKKLKVVQDVSVHLSFHIGEVILVRRMTGNYPLPHKMKEFLSKTHLSIPKKGPEIWKA